jgi:hypothetical protein
MNDDRKFYITDVNRLEVMDTLGGKHSFLVERT